MLRRRLVVIHGWSTCGPSATNGTCRIRIPSYPSRSSFYPFSQNTNNNPFPYQQVVAECRRSFFFSPSSPSDPNTHDSREDEHGMTPPRCEPPEKASFLGSSVEGWGRGDDTAARGYRSSSGDYGSGREASSYASKFRRGNTAGGNDWDRGRSGGGAYNRKRVSDGEGVGEERGWGRSTPSSFQGGGYDRGGWGASESGEKGQYTTSDGRARSSHRTPSNEYARRVVPSSAAPPTAMSPCDLLRTMTNHAGLSDGDLNPNTFVRLIVRPLRLSGAKFYGEDEKALMAVMQRRGIDCPFWLTGYELASLREPGAMLHPAAQWVPLPSTLGIRIGAPPATDSLQDNDSNSQGATTEYFITPATVFVVNAADTLKLHVFHSATCVERKIPLNIDGMPMGHTLPHAPTGLALANNADWFLKWLRTPPPQSSHSSLCRLAPISWPLAYRNHLRSAGFSLLQQTAQGLSPNGQALTSLPLADEPRVTVAHQLHVEGPATDGGAEEEDLAFIDPAASDGLETFSALTEGPIKGEGVVGESGLGCAHADSTTSTDSSPPDLALRYLIATNLELLQARSVSGRRQKAFEMSCALLSGSEAYRDVNGRLQASIQGVHPHSPYLLPLWLFPLLAKQGLAIAPAPKALSIPNFRDASRLMGETVILSTTSTKLLEAALREGADAGVFRSLFVSADQTTMSAAFNKDSCVAYYPTIVTLSPIAAPWLTASTSPTTTKQMPSADVSSSPPQLLRVLRSTVVRDLPLRLTLSRVEQSHPSFIEVAAGPLLGLVLSSSSASFSLGSKVKVKTRTEKTSQELIISRILPDANMDPASARDGAEVVHAVTCRSFAGESTLDHAATLSKISPSAMRIVNARQYERPELADLFARYVPLNLGGRPFLRPGTFICTRPSPLSLSDREDLDVHSEDLDVQKDAYVNRKRTSSVTRKSKGQSKRMSDGSAPPPADAATLPACFYQLEDVIYAAYLAITNGYRSDAPWLTASQAAELGYAFKRPVEDLPCLSVDIFVQNGMLRVQYYCLQEVEGFSPETISEAARCYPAYQFRAAQRRREYMMQRRENLNNNDNHREYGNNYSGVRTNNKTTYPRSKDNVVVAGGRRSAPYSDAQRRFYDERRSASHSSFASSFSSSSNSSLSSSHSDDFSSVADYTRRSDDGYNHSDISSIPVPAGEDNIVPPSSELSEDAPSFSDLPPEPRF